MGINLSGCKMATTTLQQAFAAVLSSIPVNDHEKSDCHTPYLSLDLETYDLVRARRSAHSYSVLVTEAIITAREFASGKDVSATMAIVRTQRSRGRSRTLRTKISSSAMSAAEEMSKSLGLTVGNVIEACVYLHLRALKVLEQQTGRGPKKQ